MFFVALTIFGAALLSRQNHHLPHLDGHFKKAIAMLLGGIFLSSLTFLFMARAARSADPFAVGYFWEFSIGLFAFFLKKGRDQFFPQKRQKISRKTFFWIAAVASPTAIASALLPMAMKLGNPGIASAIVGGAGTIFSIFFGIIFYHEHLKSRQIFPIFLILVGIFGIRFF